MAQSVRMRRQASLTLNQPGQKQVQTLSKGMLLRELVLRLNGTVTKAGTGASFTGPNLGKGDEWSWLDRVELIVNGTDAIRSLRGSQLVALNKFLYGSYPRVSRMNLGNNTAGDYDSTLIIPLWMPNSLRPMDTVLDTSKLSDIRVEVTTNTLAGFSDAGVNGVASLAANLDICTLESFGVEGKFSGSRIYPITANVPGANAAFQMQLPVTSLYRGFLINAATTSATPDRGADLANAITNVRLVSGTQVYRDIPFSVLRDWQRLRTNGVRQEIQNTAGQPFLTSLTTQPSYLNGRASDNFIEDGWAWMDLVHDGYLMEGIDTLGLSELFLEFNVNAACTLTVIPFQVFPNRNG
jgi:hypothetical protein